VIYVDQVLKEQCKYKLQTAFQTIKPKIANLETLDEVTFLSHHTTRTVVIYIDSKMTLRSLRKIFIHSHLTEDTRHKVRQLMTQNLLIHFGLVKAHIGFDGNELVDKLAKAAAEYFGELNTVYSRIPETTIGTELNKEGIRNWQGQWESTDKGGQCRSFYPTEYQRIKTEKTNNIGVQNYCLWPWEKIISPLQQLMYDCKILELKGKI